MKPVILIKTGGKAAVVSPELKCLIEDMKNSCNNYSFILVHGGGAEVTETSEVYGLKAEFINGVRMTSGPEMDVADMVLGGKINKRLVRLFESHKVPAVGLSGCDGSTFTGVRKTDDETNHTGSVTEVNTDLLSTLMTGGFTPIISSVSMDAVGTALNINADEAALAIASALKVKALVFLSDIPGILKAGQVLRTMSESDIKEEINEGVISGGMIPKVNSSVLALKEGVENVIIGNYENSGDLNALLSGEKGSKITLIKETV